MKNIPLAIVGAGAALVIVSIAACQSSDSSTDVAPGAGAGPGSGGSSGAFGGVGGTAGAGIAASAGSGGAVGGAAGSPAGAGGAGGAPCDTDLPKLKPYVDAGAGASGHYMACPSSGPGGGSSQGCLAKKQKCCQGAGADDVSVCKALAEDCPESFDTIACTDRNGDCPGAEKCCAKGTFEIHPDPMCASQVSDFKGTSCAAACAPDESVVCTYDQQCESGKKCHAFKARGGVYGVCK